MIDVIWNTLWSIIGNVKNGTTTKLWRLGVTVAIFVSYTCIVSFATWTFLEIATVRAEYVTQKAFDKKCQEIRDETHDSIKRTETAVKEIQKSNNELQQLLINKLLNGAKK